MDSFFPFFFIIIKQRNSYWISRIYFFSYSMNKIFPNTVQTRLVDFYRFSSSTTWENNKIHSWSPFGQTYSSISHGGFSYFDPRISYHRDLLLTNIYVPVSKFFPPETWKLVDGAIFHVGLDAIKHRCATTELQDNV